jgi:hypothetical protein
MSSWKKYQEDWLLFTEAGFVAVTQADEDSALKLFRAGELLNSESTLCKVGFGYLHLHKLDLKLACKMFEEVLAKEPGNEMARALLGIALSLGPTTMTQGEQILEQIHKSKDPEIKSLSDTALNFVDKFLKKSPTPLEGQKRKQ